MDVSPANVSNVTPTPTVCPFHAPIPAPKKDLDKMTQALNAFGQKLHTKLAEASPGKSFAFSVASLAPVLGMILAGISDDTDRAKLIQRIGLDNWDENRVHACLGKICRDLVTTHEGRPRIRVANGATGQVDCVDTNYLNTLKEHYNADVFTAESNITAAVNQWAAEKTEGFINKVVEDLNPNTLLCLINAIYFEADWQNCFKAKHTEPMSFTSIDGSKQKVQMMVNRDERVSVYQTPQLAYMEKKYESANGEELSLAVVLPSKEISLEQLESVLNAQELAYMRMMAQRMETHLYLPRMNLEHKIPNLGNILEEMGLPVYAALDRVLPGTKLDFILQKVRMEVDEKGTKAAAVTVGGMRCVSLSEPPPPFEFKVNRPFIAIVRSGDQILFQVSVKDTSFLEEA